MVCTGGTGSRCNQGTANNCEYKDINPNLGFPIADTPEGYQTGFTIGWDETVSPTYDIRLLFRVSYTSTFPNEEIVVPRSDGEIIRTGLSSDTRFDIYIRQENDTEAGPWERHSVYTSSVITPNSETVTFDGNIVKFDSKIVVLG